MNNEITLDREFIESIINELEESIDLLCPCPKKLLVTERICKSCRYYDACTKVYKSAAILKHIL